MNRKLNWDLIKSFLVVADTGSLSAAASALGISQPTLSRHMTELESQTGLHLFNRSRSGMQLTEKALELVDEARLVAQHASRLEMKAAGQSAELKGPVRVTASDVVSTYILPEIIAEFGRAEPLIEVELVVSNEIQNLLSRDADIAIRMTRPTQLDVVAMRLNALHMGAYARRDYLEDRGRPETIDDLFGHDLVGYDRATLILDAMKGLGISGGRELFRYRTDDQVAYWELVTAGAGVGFGPNFIASRNNDIIRILPELEIPSLEMWLAYHVELKNNPRIRRATDFIGEKLRNLDLT